MFLALNMINVLLFNDVKDCVHSHNEKHIPKLYSFDNMDIGPISLSLIVISNGILLLYSYFKSILTSRFVNIMCRYCHR